MSGLIIEHNLAEVAMQIRNAAQRAAHVLTDNKGRAHIERIMRQNQREVFEANKDGHPDAEALGPSGGRVVVQWSRGRHPLTIRERAGKFIAAGIKKDAYKAAFPLLDYTHGLKDSLTRSARFTHSGTVGSSNLALMPGDSANERISLKHTRGGRHMARFRRIGVNKFMRFPQRQHIYWRTTSLARIEREVMDAAVRGFGGSSIHLPSTVVVSRARMPR